MCRGIRGVIGMKAWMIGRDEANTRSRYGSDLLIKREEENGGYEG